MTLANPVVLEMFARARGPALLEGTLDALERILVALEGGVADGVVVTPIAGGNRVVTALDTTADGIRESSFTATITGDFATGATFLVNEIVHPSTPSLTASVTAVATETSPTSMSFTGVGGSMRTDEPGPMNASDIDYTGGNLEFDRDTGTPSGSTTCDVTGEEDPVGLTVEFEPDGEGGWQVHVTGPGIDFTFP